MGSKPKRPLTEEERKEYNKNRQNRRRLATMQEKQLLKTTKHQTYQRSKERNQRNNQSTSTIDNNEYLTIQRMKNMDYHHNFGAQHENLKNTKIGVPYDTRKIGVPYDTKNDTKNSKKVTIQNNVSLLNEEFSYIEQLQENQIRISQNLTNLLSDTYMDQRVCALCDAFYFKLDMRMFLYDNILLDRLKLYLFGKENLPEKLKKHYQVDGVLNGLLLSKKRLFTSRWKDIFTTMFNMCTSIGRF
jgi:hypothetical protein